MPKRAPAASNTTTGGYSDERRAEQRERSSVDDIVGPGRTARRLVTARRTGQVVDSLETSPDLIRDQNTPTASSL
jgi:hypothetical protein